MKKFTSDWNIIFRKEIIRLLKKEKVVDNDFINLENIHSEILDKSLIEYDFNSGVNGITRKLYETDDDFLKTYHTFIKYLSKEYFDFDFYFQEIPTIRVHCPNAKNENHYPRYHNDCLYGHPPQEKNLWFSLTKNDNSGFCVVDLEKSKKWLSEYDWDSDKFIKNAVNDESFNEKGNNLSTEVKSDINSIFIFNSLCIHTNQPRKDDSRVSIDIRINPVRGFVDGYVGRGRMKAEFKPGGKFGYHKYSVKKLKI
tara:strand:- start:1203 stop:1964 length:762 start_codon:yes stop_codon:yes gene_type:complete